MMKTRRSILIVCLLACVGSCSKPGEYAQTVCVAVDVSGTYADQAAEVTNIIRTGILPSLLPGDSLVVVNIDSDSYEKENVVGRLTLDHRPSNANAQKLAFANRLDEFASLAAGSRYTDISGAMMMCTDHLRAQDANTKAIIVFSDLQEDQPEGARRNMPPDEFAGLYVAAVNVKQLRDDTENPHLYRQRLEAWQERVTEGGAEQWKLIVDPATLPDYLESTRR
jgi:hypothetical protein